VITVLVAGQTTAVRAGLAARLSACRRFHVVVGATGLAVSDQLETTQPDVVLVDLGSGATSAWLRDLAGARRRPAIVILTDDARRVGARGILRSGARAVLPRGATTEEVVAAIEAVAAGLVVLHPDSIDAVAPMASGGDHSRTSIDHQPLTPREIEVLAMMAEGLGNKIIAARLAISEHTVKFHIASIFAKLNAGSRTEAVTIGLRRGAIMI
jgi:two-component system, NarL family, response regulator YdfI